MQDLDVNVEQLQEVLDTLDRVNINANTSSNYVLEVIRAQLQTAKKQIGKLMSNTSRKNYQDIVDTYEGGEIGEYITCIIQGAWTADSSKAAFIPEFEDIQNLRCFSEQIKEAVEASPFGIKNFKIKHLQSIRTKLASSKTIHELRQWCKMMAAQLEYFRDTQAQVTDLEYSCKWLTKEVSDMYKVTKEDYRVANRIVPCYEVGFGDIDLLKNIENAKSFHKLSDAEVSKMFGISRTKLIALRESIKLEALSKEQLEELHSNPKSEMVRIAVKEVKEEQGKDKTQEDLEYEKFFELYENLDEILPLTRN